MYQCINVKKEGKVATIILNRPEKLNSIIPEMQQEFMQAMDDIEADDSITVVIITGAGRAFCAGMDMNTMLNNIGAVTLEDLPKIVNSSKVCIAAVNGPAVANGFQMASACDFIIASEKAVFGGVGVRINEICTYCVYALPRIVGRAKANEILLTGELFDAVEAVKIGFAYKVVPHDQLMAAAHELADRIKDNAPAALKYTKQALRKAEYTSEDRFWLKKVAMKLSIMEDTIEGFAAFKEKRKPVFRGK